MPYIPHTPDDVRAMLDRIGVGSIDALFDEIPPALTVSALPGVPPISESLPGFELVNFFGFFGPAGLPDPVLKRLNAVAVQALKAPDMSAKLRASGFEPSPTTPEEFRKFIRGESAKFAKIIFIAVIAFGAAITKFFKRDKPTA